MPELSELEVVRDVLNRRIIRQVIVSAEVIPPGGPIVVRDLTGEGISTPIASARFESVVRRGKFLDFALSKVGGPSRMVTTWIVKTMGQVFLTRQATGPVAE